MLMLWGKWDQHWHNQLPRSLGFVAGSALSYKLNKTIINLSVSNKVVASELWFEKQL